MLQGIKTTKFGIEINEIEYRHYTHFGKWKSTEWVVWDGVHYYRHNHQPLNDFEQ